jgi:hypothetical protein
MVARTTRGLRLMWSALDRGSCGRSQMRSITGYWAQTHCVLDLDSAHTIAGALDRISCAIERTNRDFTYLILTPFFPLGLVFTTRTYSTTKH